MVLVVAFVYNIFTSLAEGNSGKYTTHTFSSLSSALLRPEERYGNRRLIRIAPLGFYIKAQQHSTYMQFESAHVIGNPQTHIENPFFWTNLISSTKHLKIVYLCKNPFGISCIFIHFMRFPEKGQRAQAFIHGIHLQLHLLVIYLKEESQGT